MTDASVFLYAIDDDGNAERTAMSSQPQPTFPRLADADVVSTPHRAAALARAAIETLEDRRLMSMTILSDAFTAGPAFRGKRMQQDMTLNHSVDTARSLHGKIGNEHSLFGTGNGSALRHATAMHSSDVAVIHLPSRRPESLEITAEVRAVDSDTDAAAILGFKSSKPRRATASRLDSFTGLKLSATGKLSLVENGRVTASVDYTGSYTPGTTLTLTYDINTATGTLSGVSLSGSSSDYGELTSHAFTKAATKYAVISGDAGDHATPMNVASFHVSELTLGSAPAAPILPIKPIKPIRPVTPANPVTPTPPPQVTPVAPTAPVAPPAPVTPVAPTTPVTPEVPVVLPVVPVPIPTNPNPTPTPPAEPVSPVAPVTPVEPVTPVVPVTPVEPVTPVAPAPVTPVNPNVPADVSDSTIFGLSASSSSSQQYTMWADKAASVGAKWARVTPTWDNIEPTNDSFNYAQLDAQVSAADRAGMHVSGFLGYDAKWLDGGVNKFPVNNLAEWKDYVSHVVSHTAGKVDNWEIWNEPENFATNGTPQQYAQMIIAAYDAAKAVNPNVQIGLTCADVNLQYLKEAIASGAAGHFDFIAVHPYTVLDAVRSSSFEGQYLGIVKTVKTMLAGVDPAHANVPVWFTEVGVNTNQWSQTQQAQDMVKAFTMSAAQGVKHTEWYEAIDGDAGPYGIFNNDNGNLTERPAATAMRTLSGAFTGVNDYQGWVQFNNRDYGFAFSGAKGNVLVAWAPVGVSDTIRFDRDVTIVNPLTGGSATLAANTDYTLTNSPVMVVGISDSLLATARANKSADFPWGGDYANASSVSTNFDGPYAPAGVHQLVPDTTTTTVNVGGVTARDAGKSYWQSFAVDPNFLASNATSLTITITAMAKDGKAGFNLGYESTSGNRHNTDSGWWDIPNNGQWVTKSFVITDAEFVSKWASNFTLGSDSPEYAQYYLKSVTVAKTVAATALASTPVLETRLAA